MLINQVVNLTFFFFLIFYSYISNLMVAHCVDGSDCWSYHLQLFFKERLILKVDQVFSLVLQAFTYGKSKLLWTLTLLLNYFNYLDYFLYIHHNCSCCYYCHLDLLLYFSEQYSISPIFLFIECNQFLLNHLFSSFNKLHSLSPSSPVPGGWEFPSSPL